MQDINSAKCAGACAAKGRDSGFMNKSGECICTENVGKYADFIAGRVMMGRMIVNTPGKEPPKPSYRFDLDE